MYHASNILQKKKKLKFNSWHLSHELINIKTQHYEHSNVCTIDLHMYKRPSGLDGHLSPYSSDWHVKESRLHWSLIKLRLLWLTEPWIYFVDVWKIFIHKQGVGGSRDGGISEYLYLSSCANFFGSKRPSIFYWLYSQFHL